MGGDDPELDLGVDVLTEVELDGVEAELLERALDLDVVGLDREVVGVYGGGGDSSAAGVAGGVGHGYR